MSFEASLATKVLIETGSMSVPIDLNRLTKAKGIIVQEDNCDGYSGMLLVVNGQAMISVKKAIREIGRKRYTIAHEVGHYSLPGHLTKEKALFQCSDDQLRVFGENKTKEIEANIFASELLMPEKLFKPKVADKDITKKLIGELTDEFQTSLTATCIKLINCKNDYALVCSEDSRIKWFCRGDEFPYYLNSRPGSPVHHDSFAHHFFETTKTHDNFYEVPVESWIDDKKADASVAIMEMVIGVPSYNIALSFLYAEKNNDNNFCEDSEEYTELNGNLEFRK